MIAVANILIFLYFLISIFFLFVHFPSCSANFEEKNWGGGNPSSCLAASFRTTNPGYTTRYSLPTLYNNVYTTRYSLPTLYNNVYITRYSLPTL